MPGEGVATAAARDEGASPPVVAWPFIPAALRRSAIANLCWALLFVSAGLAVAWFRTIHLDEAAALYGFSPSALLDPVWRRPGFAADFPSGEAPMLASLVGQAYELIGHLPLSRRLAVGIMIFVEFVVLGGGAFLCARAASPRLPAWTAAAVALLLTTGSLVSCDLARWFHPYYGSAYNVAYGFGLAAFGAMLRRRPVLAGGSLGVAAAAHPIIGLFFGLAVAAAALVDLGAVRFPRLVAGAVVAVVLAGGWGWLMLGGVGVTGDAVDAGLYISLARLMSSHWFPLSIGIFSDRAFETSVPFVGFMVVVAAVLRPFAASAPPADRQIGAAILLLLAVTVAGVFLSEFSDIPLLVKLALHRASSEVLLLGAIAVVPRLARDVVSGTVVRAALAAALLLLSFWRDHGPPILLCVAFAVVVLAEERRSRARGESALLAAAVVAACALVAANAYAGVVPLAFGNINLGVSTLREPWFLAAIVAAGAAWLLRMPAVLAGAMAIGVAAWVPLVDPMRDASELDRARAFLQVQRWARADTPPDAVFMVDPSYSYGWREMSERPSFGTLREWLYSGWIYDTRASVFAEGLERARWLGLDLDRYLNADDVAAAYAAMWQQAKTDYNSMDAQRLQETAARFGVSYFVFDRQNRKVLPDLPVAFESGRYAVLAARK